MHMETVHIEPRDHSDTLPPTLEIEYSLLRNSRPFIRLMSPQVKHDEWPDYAPDIQWR